MFFFFLLAATRVCINTLFILFSSHDFYLKTRFVQALTKPLKIYVRDNCTKNPRLLPTPPTILHLDSALSSWRHRVDTCREKQFMPFRACVHRLLISHITMPLPSTRVRTKYLRRRKPCPAWTAAPFAVFIFGCQPVIGRWRTRNTHILLRQGSTLILRQGMYSRYRVFYCMYVEKPNGGRHKCY